MARCRACGKPYIHRQHSESGHGHCIDPFCERGEVGRWNRRQGRRRDRDAGEAARQLLAATTAPAAEAPAAGPITPAHAQTEAAAPVARLVATFKAPPASVAQAYVRMEIPVEAHGTYYPGAAPARTPAHMYMPPEPVFARLPPPPVPETSETPAVPATAVGAPSAPAAVDAFNSTQGARLFRALPPAMWAPRGAEPGPEDDPVTPAATVAEPVPEPQDP